MHVQTLPHGACISLALALRCGYGSRARQNCFQRGEYSSEARLAGRARCLWGGEVAAKEAMTAPVSPPSCASRSHGEHSSSQSHIVVLHCTSLVSPCATITLKS